MPPKPKPVIERLRARIEVTDAGCWEWQGARDADGYGRIAIGSRANGSKQQNARTHRVAYLELVGPIPDGLVIDHLCRNRLCCNPEHLEPVTDRVNTVVRGRGPIAAQARQTACKNGHPFTPENTWASPTTGKKSCRACRRTGARKPRGPRRKISEG